MGWSLSLLGVVLLLGILQLAVGVVLGRCLPLREPKSSRLEPRDVEALRYFARRLFDLATSVANDVDRHQTEIRQLNHNLGSMPSEGGQKLMEFVTQSVGQIMQINEGLQARLSAAEQRLREQTEYIESQIAEARTDPLTGLPNRRCFDDELARRTAEWRRRRVPFCLLLMDVDHFKRLNDQLGHPAGDQALRETAELLSDTLREMDMAARIGGEEFAIILPGTSPEDACRAAERIRLAVGCRAWTLEQAPWELTVSLGVAVVAPGDDPASLVKRADEALYAAKRGGRNCGYFHGGDDCRRIEPGQGVDTREKLPDSDVLTAAELAAVCDDLRSRLAEVTNEQTDREE